MIIYVCKVMPGKNQNWINLSVMCGRMDVNKSYTVKFCGTEVDCSLTLTDQQNEKFLDGLKRIFGMAPFDIEEAKAALKDNLCIDV